MTPKINDYVKIYFKNGLEADGTVVSWSDTKSTVTAPDGQSNILILNTLADVMMVQVFAKEEEAQSIGLRQHMTELEEQFEETYALPNSDETRLQKLAELKDLMNKEERKIVSKHLQTNSLSKQYVENQYGTPDFLKK